MSLDLVTGGGNAADPGDGRADGANLRALPVVGRVPMKVRAAQQTCEEEV